MYVKNEEAGPLGAPCLSCDAAGRRGRTHPTRMNIKLAAKYGWKTAPGSGYSGPGDWDLAKDIYCLQHQVESCSGSCNPTTKQQDCYNRDGMLGLRTMQAIANEINKGSSLGKVWQKRIILPPKYLTGGVKSLPPASDVRSDVAACQGTAGQIHCSQIKKVAEIAPISIDSTQHTSHAGLFLLLGLGGLLYLWRKHDEA